MNYEWSVRVSDVWKRYCGNLRRGAVYALGDALKTFCNLNAREVQLRKEEFWSLQGVDFEVTPGECLAVIGRNGAGKSTLLKLLTGVIPPDRGELRVRGRLIALMMSGAGFHPMLSGRENIYIYGSFLGLSRRELDRRFDQIVAFSELGDFIDTPVKYYSSGMYVRLSYSIATQADPDVLLVDEVLAVGDLAFREKCLRHLQELKRRGTSLLVVSHSTGQLRRLADRAIWLDRGRPIACGPASDVLAQYMAEGESLTFAAPAAPAMPGTAPLTPVIPSAETFSSPNQSADQGVESQAIEEAEVDVDAPIAPYIPCEPVELQQFTFNGLAVDGDAVLRSDAVSNPVFEFRLRFGRRIARPVMRLFVLAEGREVGRVDFIPRRGAFPQTEVGHEFKLRWALQSQLRADQYELRFVIVEEAYDGVNSTLFDYRRILQVTGKRLDAEHTLDLQPRFQVHADPTPNESEIPSSCERRIPVSGERILIKEPVRFFAEPTAAFWRLENRSGHCLQTAEVTFPANTSGGNELRLQGDFVADLSPGVYRQVFETEDATGKRFVILDRALIIADPGESLGNAHLEQRLWYAEIDQVEASSLVRIPPSSGELKINGIYLRQAATEADSAEADDGDEQTVRDSSEAPLRVLSTGEACTLMVDVELTEPLFDLTIEGILRKKLKPNIAGFRFHDVRAADESMRFRLAIDFLVNLTPTEYLLDLNFSATDTSGNKYNLQLSDVARLLVRGAPAMPYESLLQLTGRAAVRQIGLLLNDPSKGDVEVDDSDRDPWIVADPSTIRVTTEICDLTLGGNLRSPSSVISENAVIPVATTIAAGPLTRCPGFKFSITTPDRRRIASVDTTLVPAWMPRLSVERIFRLEFRVVHRLCPGVYDVHIALWDQRSSSPQVVARRPFAAKMIVPSAGRSVGEFYLRASASFELISDPLLNENFIDEELNAA